MEISKNERGRRRTRASAWESGGHPEVVGCFLTITMPSSFLEPSSFSPEELALSLSEAINIGLINSFSLQCMPQGETADDARASITLLEGNEVDIRLTFRGFEVSFFFTLAPCIHLYYFARDLEKLTEIPSLRFRIAIRPNLNRSSSLPPPRTHLPLLPSTKRSPTSSRPSHPSTQRNGTIPCSANFLMCRRIRRRLLPSRLETGVSFHLLFDDSTSSLACFSSLRGWRVHPARVISA